MLDILFRATESVQWTSLVLSLSEQIQIHSDDDDEDYL